MADNTKEETKPTDDVEFLQEVNYSNDRRGHSQHGKSMGEFGPDYSHRKQYQMRKPPYAPHVREYYGDLGREMTDGYEPNEAHDTQQPPLDIQPTNRYEPHPIEPYAAPKKDNNEKVDDSYELYRDD